MVTQHSDQMAEFFERFSENVQTVAETGRRCQESMFKAAGEAFRCRPSASDSTQFAGKFADGAAPLVGDNLDAFANCFDAGSRSGVKVFKAVCDSAANNDNSDWYGKTRGVWDAMFSASKTTAEAIAKVGSATMENWSRFCHSVCAEETGSKPGPKASK